MMQFGNKPTSRGRGSMNIRPVRLISGGSPSKEDAPIEHYVTMQDISLAALKIILAKRGISLEQLSRATRLSVTTVDNILNQRKDSHISLNTLHLILHTILRMSWADLDDIIRIASVNLMIVKNIRISEVRDTYKNATKLPQAELERLMYEPVISWAHTKGYLSFD